MNVIEVDKVSKHYGGEQVLNQVSFSVAPGQVLGIVGPNGSGKTTLFGVMLGLREAQEGSIQFFGSSDLQSIKSRIGVAMDQGSFYHSYSAEKNLRLSAISKGVNPDRIPEVLKMVDLAHTGSKAYKKFSYGMKKRLEIADALLHEPDIYIFDEPTNGLDPEGIIFIRKLITQLSEEGKTVIVSSHYLQEIEKVCSHILMLRRGVNAFYGTAEELREKHGDLEGLFIGKQDTV
jgi:ABC-2 type transport system ATP-binding protein